MLVLSLFTYFELWMVREMNWCRWNLITDNTTAANKNGQISLQQNKTLPPAKLELWNMLTLIGKSNINSFKKYSKEKPKCFPENSKDVEANSSIKIYGFIL